LTRPDLEPRKLAVLRAQLGERHGDGVLARRRRAVKDHALTFDHAYIAPIACRAWSASVTAVPNLLSTTRCGTAGRSSKSMVAMYSSHRASFHASRAAERKVMYSRIDSSSHCTHTGKTSTPMDAARLHR